MRGRQVFMDSLVAHGADAIFGNPGTTENPLLDSLLDYPQIQYYVALHEGVAVGAAGYYARASGKTAVTNLHVAPGLGNAIGMIYGVLKGAAPVVVTAGQQDTRMRLRDPILRHDLVAMAAPVTKWAVEPQHADEIAPIMRRAFKIANEPPAGPVFVALPINVMEQETDNVAGAAGDLFQHCVPDAAGVERLVELMLASANPAIAAGDDISAQGASDRLTELAERTGAAVYIEFLHTRQPISNRHPNFRGRIPYETGKIRTLFGEHDLVLLIGGSYFEEVWFDAGSPFPQGMRVAQIESAESRLAHNYPLDLGLIGHLPEALGALLSGLDTLAPAAFKSAAAARNTTYAARNNADTDAYVKQLARLSGTSPMSPGEALHCVAAALPHDVIIVDETVTGAGDLDRAFELSDNNFFSGRGGGIGQGIAGALGVAAAHPQRLVAAISGDGSAMYSIQALWTAAHHGLNIVFVILSNREYRVLKHNLDAYRQRFNARAERPYPHMDLTRPVLGFVEMANGMGVEARQASTPQEIKEALELATRTSGPFLIDLVVSGKV